MRSVQCCLALLLPVIALTAPVGCEEDPPPFEVTTGAASAGAGGGGGGTVAPSISESDASDFETDPQIAVLKGQLVGVVWTAGRADGSSHIGYRFSTDGGASWGAIGKIESSFGDFYLDPDLAIDNQGNVYVVWLSFSREGAGGHILSAKTTESKLTFGEAVHITDAMTLGFYDRPRVTITKTGRVFVAYTEVLAGINDLAMGLSDDGVEWTKVSLGTADAQIVTPFPCAAAQFGVGVGRSWIGFQFDGRLRLAWSDDDGMTWQGGYEAQAPGDEGGVFQPAYCVGDGSQVWVAYGIRSSGGLLGRIRIGYSADGGQTFQSYIDAHDTVSQRFLNPTLSMETVEPRGLDLVYYAGAGPGDSVATLRRAHTPLAGADEDGGLPEPAPDAGPDAGPLLPSEVVHKPVKLEIARSSPAWLGEYIGSASSQGKLFIAYVDNGSGSAHVVFQRVDAP